VLASFLPRGHVCVCTSDRLQCVHWMTCPIMQIDLRMHSYLYRV
jgi:hypothetical protein